MDKIYISMMAAMSLDGLISLHESAPVTFTSREDKELLRHTIENTDCLLVGRRTYELSQSILEKRTCVVFSNNPDLRSHKPNITYSQLSKESIQKLSGSGKKFLLLGGSQIYHWFIKEGLVNELLLTVEPIVLTQGVPIISDISLHQRFNLVSSRILNSQGTVLLHYLTVNQ